MTHWLDLVQPWLTLKNRDLRQEIMITLWNSSSNQPNIKREKKDSIKKKGKRGDSSGGLCYTTGWIKLFLE
jgi:hypothetical protein